MGAYKLMKRIIERDLETGKLDREAVMDKLETFYATDRMSKDEYKELMAMVNPQPEAEESAGE